MTKFRIDPTVNVHPEAPADCVIGKSYLTIAIEIDPRDGGGTGDKWRPESHFRGMNVGVGGKHLRCHVAPGEPVRRATLGELRRLDRIRITEMLARAPHGTIVVSRSRH